MALPGLYRAKVATVNGSTITAFIPQVFGDTAVTVRDFSGSMPSTAAMGWVGFQGGMAEFPVWISAVVTAAAAATPPDTGGGGTVTDTLWVGTSAPTDSSIELWYDTDEPVTGGGGGSGGTYTHNQTSPASTWIIIHNMGFFPQVTVVDSTGEQVEGEVDYIDANTVNVTFSSAFSGKAYLS